MTKRLQSTSSGRCSTEGRMRLEEEATARAEERALTFSKDFSRRRTAPVVVIREAEGAGVEVVAS